MIFLYFNRFKIDLLNFHSFIVNISTKSNISKKWNAQGVISRKMVIAIGTGVVKANCSSKLSIILPSNLDVTFKGLIKKINRIHGKSPRLVLSDHQSTLAEKLDTLNENTIHQQSIDRLLTEVYKFLNGYSPDIMKYVFHLRQNTYNLRNFDAFATDVPRDDCMLNSVVYRANQL